MAYSSLLQLSAFDCDHNVVGASFEYLNKQDHLFVFQEVVRASLEIEGIGRDQSLQFRAKLWHHCLIQVAIAPSVIWVGFRRVYFRPTSQRLWVSDDEEGKAEERHCGRI